ncbi:hypothetical protein M885DRAFT_165472 [Pelagophyceae sp. CCMP2097]|nr:hypothetical protein M885DRAFT_165472 [Pelagophyceae sp. CCMP2097]
MSCRVAAHAQLARGRARSAAHARRAWPRGPGRAGRAARRGQSSSMASSSSGGCGGAAASAAGPGGRAPFWTPVSGCAAAAADGVSAAAAVGGPSAAAAAAAATCCACCCLALDFVSVSSAADRAMSAAPSSEPETTTLNAPLADVCTSSYVSAASHVAHASWYSLPLTAEYDAARYGVGTCEGKMT